MEIIKSNNFIFTLSSNDNMSNGIMKGHFWEPHLIQFMREFLREGDTVIDVGACFGWHTLEMARIVGDSGLVYSFEPQKNNLELLNMNIVQNNMLNIQVFNFALGHKLMKTCICNAYGDNEKNFGDSFISTNFELGAKDLHRTDSINKAGRQLPLNKQLVQCVPLDNIKFDNNKKIKFIKL